MAAELTRRTILAGIAASPLALAMGTRPAGAQAAAASSAARHGLSVFGELKYPADFKHFDYVNPTAPKGGRFVLTAANWYYNQSRETFNTLNGYTFKGDAPPRVELCFDTLMTSALDEPDTLYGLVAETVRVDGSHYVFALRPEARFHDGSPLTADDVVFSFLTLKEKGHPDISQTIREMVSVTANGPHQVTVTFSGKQGLKVPLIVAGSLPIFSKAFYATRDFAASTMEPPLGSGGYRMDAVQPGRSIDYVRVEDYWAKDLPVSVGTGNFDRIRLEFYQNDDAEFQAFAKGEIDWREENSSKQWATGYDFPAVRDGKVKRPAFASEKRADMYGWFFNLRRAQFADPRTRQAIAMVFDFAWSNKNLFYGLYRRETSFFQLSDLAATGLPAPAELALLEPHRAALPPEAFGPAFILPEADGSGRDRKMLRTASDLLRAAGWKPAGSGLQNDAGQTLAIEFLINSQLFERVLLPYIANLKAIGVSASIRLVDAAQYQQRHSAHDYDILASRILFDATPMDGVEQIFGSIAADVPSGSNLSGLKDPVVDDLVARAASVTSRADLVTVLRALDRVLRAKNIWIPAWYSDAHRVAVWDKFGWPDSKPDYGFSPETTWWYDAGRAKAAGLAG